MRHTAPGAAPVTVRGPAALEALPAEGIAPRDICAELDIADGSTWTEVRADILGGIENEMRLFEVNVERAGRRATCRAEARQPAVDG
jgi:hypothetical protein